MKKQHPVDFSTALVYQPARNSSYRSANVYRVRSSCDSETDQITGRADQNRPVAYHCTSQSTQLVIFSWLSLSLCLSLRGTVPRL
jgi:hypothetical protein